MIEELPDNATKEEILLWFDAMEKLNTDLMKASQDNNDENLRNLTKNEAVS